MRSILVSRKASNKSIVTQSNKLTEARYFLTIGEQKIILLLISMISPEDTDFKNYEMKVSEFSDVMGLSSKSIYERMDDTLDKLMSRVIHIPEKRGFLKIGWVSSARYIEGEGVIQLSFDKELKPYLLQLKEQFTKYNLFTVTSFKSAYSVRIYMLLKQYESIGKREFELDEFKEILGIEGKSYDNFKSFRQWVLNQAKKEFETKNKATGAYQSDITFDLETIRTGRKITRLRFNIRKQKYQEALPLDLTDTDHTEQEISKARETLEKYGVKGKVADKYLDSQSEAEIFRCIELLEVQQKKGKVQSASGYLLKLLEDRAGELTNAEKKEALVTQKKAQEKAELERLEKEKEQLETDYKEARNNAVDDFLVGCDDEAIKDIQVEFEQSEAFEKEVKGVSFVRSLYKEKGINSPMISAIYKKFIVAKYLPSEFLSLDNFVKAKKLKS